jgi:hypothetical protein
VSGTVGLLWRGARVVEWARLEREYAGNRIGSSNLPLSANDLYKSTAKSVLSVTN